MNEKGKIKKDKDLHAGLAVEMYLILDIIILFVLCLLCYKGLNYYIIFALSLIFEFITTLYISLKYNVKTSCIFFILLLVSPIFLGLMAMSLAYITQKLPFTLTLLVLFRNGYDMQGRIIDNFLRIIIAFRIPALIAILISIIYLKLNTKNAKSSK